MENIKKLRAATGLGMMACKKALDEANGDVDKAIEILRKKGAIKAAQRAEREASEGIVGSYIHSNGKIGVLAEIKIL
jgi:elongation factor Ts